MTIFALVSIPQGTIKRYSERILSSSNLVSIPQGTIKSVKILNLSSRNTCVSIPQGTIKSGGRGQAGRGAAGFNSTRYD